MSNDFLEEAYTEGYWAGQTGACELANPYPNGCMDHELWSDGLEDAQEDMRHV